LVSRFGSSEVKPDGSGRSGEVRSAIELLSRRGHGSLIAANRAMVVAGQRPYKLQSAGPSLTPPLLQNRTGPFSSIRLLSIRAIVIGTTQVLTNQGRLTTELLGQLAFTTSRTCAIKHEPFSSAVVFPNTRPPSAYLWHYPEPWLPFDKPFDKLRRASGQAWGIPPAGASGWLPTRSKPRAVSGLLRSTD
jgi:hypothetical protein